MNKNIRKLIPLLLLCSSCIPQAYPVPQFARTKIMFKGNFSNVDKFQVNVQDINCSPNNPCLNESFNINVRDISNGISTVPGNKVITVREIKNNKIISQNTVNKNAVLENTVLVDLGSQALANVMVNNLLSDNALAKADKIQVQITDSNGKSETFTVPKSNNILLGLNQGNNTVSFKAIDSAGKVIEEKSSKLDIISDKPLNIFPAASNDKTVPLNISIPDSTIGSMKVIVKSSDGTEQTFTFNNIQDTVLNLTEGNKTIIVSTTDSNGKTSAELKSEINLVAGKTAQLNIPSAILPSAVPTVLLPSVNPSSNVNVTPSSVVLSPVPTVVVSSPSPTPTPSIFTGGGNSGGVGGGTIFFPTPSPDSTVSPTANPTSLTPNIQVSASINPDNTGVK